MLLTLKSCSEVCKVQSKGAWCGGMTQRTQSVELMKVTKTEHKSSTQQALLKTDLKELSEKQVAAHNKM